MRKNSVVSRVVSEDEEQAYAQQRHHQCGNKKIFVALPELRQTLREERKDNSKAE